MTPRTETESRPSDLRSSPRAVGVLLGAAVLVILLVAPALDTGPFAPRLTVANPSLFDVNVELTGTDPEASFDLGTIGRETQVVLEEIADPGGQWTFRFSHAGFEAGELALTESALDQVGWHLAIPPEVGERLSAAGFQPSAL